MSKFKDNQIKYLSIDSDYQYDLVLFHQQLQCEMVELITIKESVKKRIDILSDRIKINEKALKRYKGDN